MQKWLPDEFESSAPAATLPDPSAGAWETLPQDPQADGPRFHKESRFADPTTLMAHLTQAERAMIFDLVEQDVAQDYDEREVALKTKQAEELAAAHADYEARLERWIDQFASGLAAHLEERLHETAQAAASLAIELAGKITRTLVPLDPQILERALQTALYKAPSNVRLNIRMNPEDADWLGANEELTQRLGIESVVPDRRIERGGCLVQAGPSEWDATIGGQLEALGEIIQEAISTSEADPAHRPAIPPVPQAASDPAATPPSDSGSEPDSNAGDDDALD